MDIGSRQALINKNKRKSKPSSRTDGAKGKGSSLRVYCPQCPENSARPENSVHVSVNAKTRFIKCPAGHVTDCTCKCH